MRLFGYARVSTNQQSLDTQIKALKMQVCDLIVSFLTKQVVKILSAKAFYRPAEMNEKSYQHISDIFTSKEPNWQLIESMYYDMLRVVMSILSGKLKGSLY